MSSVRDTTWGRDEHPPGADVASVLALVGWRPLTAAILAVGTFTAAAIVVAAGGPPGAWIACAVALIAAGWVCGRLARSLLRQLDELECHNQETMLASVRPIDARDPNTARHSERVAEYSAALATALGLERQSIERIRHAAGLHDVGRLALERRVLETPGLVGDEIPLDARIIAVADAYEAMTSERAHELARSHEEALARLMDGAGTQFDPTCVAAFLALDLVRAGAVAHGNPIPAG